MMSLNEFEMPLPVPITPIPRNLCPVCKKTSEGRSFNTKKLSPHKTQAYKLQSQDLGGTAIETITDL